MSTCHKALPDIEWHKRKKVKKASTAFYFNITFSHHKPAYMHYTQNNTCCVLRMSLLSLTIFPGLWKSFERSSAKYLLSASEHLEPIHWKATPTLEIVQRILKVKRMWEMETLKSKSQQQTDYYLKSWTRILFRSTSL